MSRKRVVSPLWVSVVLLCAASVALAAGPVLETELAAKKRSELWTEAFSSFVSHHPDLNVEQLSLIWEAIDLATPETFSERPGLAEKGQDLPLVTVVRRAEELFSTHQLGEIFSRMGPLQTWLVKTEVAGEFFCDCYNMCEECNPIPGDCVTDCISWTGDDNNGVERDWTGICTVQAAAAQMGQ